MSVTFTWDNDEQTQLRFIFDVMWQVEDLQRMIYLSQDIIEDRDDIIDIIIDMSHCESMPSNMSLLPDHLQVLDHNRVGVMVFVTQNKYIQQVMQLLNQLMRRYFVMHFTNSLTKAHRIVKRASTTRQHQSLS